VGAGGLRAGLGGAPIEPLPRAQVLGARVLQGVPQEGAPRDQRRPGRPGVGDAAGPNKGLQATANSLRSCLAPAIPSA
jgi:hypothetical protein